MLVILSFSSIISFHLEAKEVGTVMELGWADLVPSNWVPPLIQPDLSKEHEADPKSLVAALDMQEVKIPGYMLPIKISGNLVSEFVLMPFLDHHTQVHIHHEPNQMVYVILTEPAQIANPFLPVWATGEMYLQSTETDKGHTGYTLKAASIEPYLY